MYGRFNAMWPVSSLEEIESIPGLLDLKVSGLLEPTCLPHLLTPFVNLQTLHLDFSSMRMDNIAAALLPRSCSKLRWLVHNSSPALCTPCIKRSLASSAWLREGLNGRLRQFIAVYLEGKATSKAGKQLLMQYSGIYCCLSRELWPRTSKSCNLTIIGNLNG